MSSSPVNVLSSDVDFHWIHVPIPSYPDAPPQLISYLKQHFPVLTSGHDCDPEDRNIHFLLFPGWETLVSIYRRSSPYAHVRICVISSALSFDDVIRSLVSPLIPGEIALQISVNSTTGEKEQHQIEVSSPFPVHALERAMHRHAILLPSLDLALLTAALPDMDVDK